MHSSLSGGAQKKGGRNMVAQMAEPVSGGWPRLTSHYPVPCKPISKMPISLLFLPSHPPPLLTPPPSWDACNGQVSPLMQPPTRVCSLWGPRLWVSQS